MEFHIFQYSLTYSNKERKGKNISQVRNELMKMMHANHKNTLKVLITVTEATTTF